MSKEQEIEALLNEGASPKDLIGRGFKRSTVYKVNKKLGRGRTIKRRPKRTELKYVIVGLEQEGGGVKMTLREAFELPSPEALERLRLAAEEPEHDVEEATQLQKIIPEPQTAAEEMVAAIKRQAPEMFAYLINPPPLKSLNVAYGPTMIRRNIEIHLSYEEYLELGVPSLLAEVKLTLELSPASSSPV